MGREKLCRDEVGQYQLHVALCSAVAHLVRGREVLLRSRVVLFQEANDAAVILESYLVGFGERGERRHVRTRGAQRAEYVFGKGDAVEFEVGLEEQVGGIVESPFARVFQWVAKGESNLP